MNPPGERSGVSRRRFLHRAVAAAATVSIVPSHVLGGAGRAAPNDRLTVAFIGVGSQGLRVMLEFLAQPDVQAVAVCDPNRESADYPQWSPGEFRNRVRRVLGTSTGWEELSPDRPIELTPRLRVTAGVAGREPGRRIVDAVNARDRRSGVGRGCAAYSDFRELLSEVSDLDAVVVGTTDHWHALISVAAMRAGKHVFCQKPMTRTVFEARRMADVARETGVATQVAVGIQATENVRRVRDWIRAGVIGRVREVHNWSNRPLWPQGVPRPRDETIPVPEGLDWNLWLGPAPARPYHPAYLPFVWRGWRDFGAGALGDMGCYSFDTIFRALDLGAPESIEASSSELYPDSYPKASIVHYRFPARGDLPSVKLTWYDGGLKPPGPEEWNAPLPEEGLLFIGDEGKILAGFSGWDARLLPESRMKDFKPPEPSLPPSPGNEREWLDACRGSGNAPGANFEFSGKVTEALLLGNVAILSGARLTWDSTSQKASGGTDIESLVRPGYRGDWRL